MKPTPNPLTGVTVAQAYRKRAKNQVRLKALKKKLEAVQLEVDRVEAQLNQARAYDFEFEGVAISHQVYGYHSFSSSDFPSFRERHASVWQNVKDQRFWGIDFHQTGEVYGCGGNGFTYREARLAALNWIVHATKPPEKWAMGKP